MLFRREDLNLLCIPFHHRRLVHEERLELSIPKAIGSKPIVYTIPPLMLGTLNRIRTYNFTAFETVAYTYSAIRAGGTDENCTHLKTFCRRLHIYSATVPYY